VAQWSRRQAEEEASLFTRTVFLGGAKKILSADDADGRRQEGNSNFLICGHLRHLRIILAVLKQESPISF
jgi:hypothetical protein